MSCLELKCLKATRSFNVTGQGIKLKDDFSTLCQQKTAASYGLNEHHYQHQGLNKGCNLALAMLRAKHERTRDQQQHAATYNPPCNVMPLYRKLVCQPVVQHQLAR